MLATATAGGLAARGRRHGATGITSSTGSRAGQTSRTTWSFSVAGIIGWCTRADGSWSNAMTGRSSPSRRPSRSVCQESRTDAAWSFRFELQGQDLEGGELQVDRAINDVELFVFALQKVAKKRTRGRQSCPQSSFAWPAPSFVQPDDRRIRILGALDRLHDHLARVHLDE